MEVVFVDILLPFPNAFSVSKRTGILFKKEEKRISMTNFDSRKNFRLRIQPLSPSQKERRSSSFSNLKEPSAQETSAQETSAQEPSAQEPSASGMCTGENVGSSFECSVIPADHISSTLTNTTNQARIEAFSNAVKEIFGDVLDSRFYGNVTFHFTVQGGIIQTIRSGVERSIR